MRGRSCSACGYATGCGTAAMTRRSSTTSTSTTRSTTLLQVRAPSWPRARPVVPPGRGSRPGCRTGSKRPSTSRDRLHRGSVGSGHAYAVEGTSFRVVSDPTTAGVRTARTRWSRARIERAREIRATSRQSQQAGRGHLVDSPWDGPPGWHIGAVMAERRSGRSSDPRRRNRPAVPAPRERARAVERARPSLRAHLDAQRDARVRRREDVEVARQRCVASQRDRHVGERGRAPLLHDRALAQADRLHRRDAAAGERNGRASARRSTSGSRLPSVWEAFEAALDDDFNTPEARGRSPRVAAGEPARAARRGSASSLGFVPRDAPDDVRRSPRTGGGACAATGSGRWLRRRWQPRLGRPGRWEAGHWFPVTREQVYSGGPCARRSVAGARCSSWATERAVKGESWLRETVQPACT